MTNTNETPFSKWLSSSYAQQYLQSEARHLKNALRQVSGPRVLQLGNLIDSSEIEAIDFPQHIIADIDAKASSQDCVQFDPAFMPLQNETMSTVIVPHVLERHQFHHQVLRESNRVLMPEGHIILTGFNPISMLGVQRLIFKRAVCPGHYFSVKRVSDWLQLLGFEIVASSTFAYSPLVKNERIRKTLNFLNALGDRWLPMLGGGYMITARKKQPGGTLVGRLDFAKPAIKKRRRKLASASSQSKNRKSTSCK
ncbi:class I SAM-dependent methyltransferase [Arenicella sp.]|nr:class I SAM-dependent methyltransferase [Arenicella sp.]